MHFTHQNTNKNTGDDIPLAFIQHYQAIRSNPLFKASTLLYIMENNLGREQDHLRRIVVRSGRFDNAYVLFEHPNVVGFHSDRESKLHADHELQRYIYMDGVRFYKEIISVNTDESRCGDKAKDMLIDQIRNMCEYTERTPRGESKTVITSIFDSDKKRLKGKNDDVQRAFSMLIDVAQRFYAFELKHVDYKRIYLLQENRKEYTHGVLDPVMVPGRKRTMQEMAPCEDVDDLTNML